MVHGSLSVLPGALTFSDEESEDSATEAKKEVPVRWEENPESIRVTDARGIFLLRTRKNQMKSNKIRTDMTVGSMRFTGDLLSHW